MSPDLTTDDAEQRTRDEFERVLRTQRFATIHELVRSPGFRDLTDGSQRSPQPADGSAPADLPRLPSRR